MLRDETPDEANKNTSVKIVIVSGNVEDSHLEQAQYLASTVFDASREQETNIAISVLSAIH